MHRQTVLIFFLALLCGIFALDVWSRASAQETRSAQVVVDQDNGAVRIVIDKKEVARFTSAGLEVRNDVSFGGVMTDIGPEKFDANTSSGAR